MIRAFIAVELDAALRAGIAGTQARLRRALAKTIPDARLQWVRAESIHLTLKFLGSVEERRVSEIAEAVGRALSDHRAMTVEVGGLGVFPDLQRPRVLWIGLSGPEPASGHPQGVTMLAAAVDRALGTIGFPPEDRPFSPHLTLARIKERAREVGQALQDLGVLESPPPVGRLHVRSVSLMKSELHPSGAVYARLHEWPLRSET
jgi:2'-5' RNA ligase